ncbi:ferritin-like protein [Hellea sp.]|nr:ferritin-like protein [Hellea sp.]
MSIDREEVPGEEARELLGTLLQAALELEFATIPPYLSAALSLGNSNKEILFAILRAAKEEMLHMTIVANLMNAIGIAPDIIKAAPDYPYKLEMLESDLEVYLSSFSFDLIENLFMRIETPEDPVDFGITEQEPETIGQFYEQIIAIIQSEKIPDLFRDAETNKFKQVTFSIQFSKIKYKNNQDDYDYPLREGYDFIITNKEAAVGYLSWIVDQGEGSIDPGEDSPNYNPLTVEGVPSHFYRFKSILEGKYLIADDTAPNKFSYSGGDIPFSAEGIIEFANNVKAEQFDEYPDLQEAMMWFNEQYSEMVNQLNLAFNPSSREEKDQAYNTALNIMQGMRTLASDVFFEANSSGIKAGIPFQYIDGGVNS